MPKLIIPADKAKKELYGWLFENIGDDDHRDYKPFDTKTWCLHNSRDEFAISKYGSKILFYNARYSKQIIQLKLKFL